MRSSEGRAAPSRGRAARAGVPIGLALAGLIAALLGSRRRRAARPGSDPGRPGGGASEGPGTAEGPRRAEFPEGAEVPEGKASSAGPGGKASSAGPGGKASSPGPDGKGSTAGPDGKRSSAGAGADGKGSSAGAGGAGGGPTRSGWWGAAALAVGAVLCAAVSVLGYNRLSHWYRPVVLTVTTNSPSDGQQITLTGN